MADGEILDLVAKYGPAVAEFIGANRSANQFQSAMSEEAISDQFDDLRENLPQYDVGPAFRKYLATAMENPVADAARRQVDETEATSIDALRGAGAGAIQGQLSRLLRQTEGQRSRIDAKEQADLNRALGVFAQQEQRANMMNTQAQQRIDSAELAAQRQAALQSAIVDAQRRRATGQAIGQGLELLGDLEGGGGRDLLNRLQLDRYFKGAAQEEEDEFGQVEDVDLTLKSGGMMTPGAFSHESNPIDVVQDGTKIAELTGGEIVLNPDQSNQVAKESSFFRKLRRKFKKAQQKTENES